MAGNYTYGPQSVSYQPNAFFLQPYGSVYLIGSSLEIANVPMNNGLAVKDDKSMMKELIKDHMDSWSMEMKEKIKNY